MIVGDDLDGHEVTTQGRTPRYPPHEEFDASQEEMPGSPFAFSPYGLKVEVEDFPEAILWKYDLLFGHIPDASVVNVVPLGGWEAAQVSCLEGLGWSAYTIDTGWRVDKTPSTAAPSDPMESYDTNLGRDMYLCGMMYPPEGGVPRLATGERTIPRE